MERTSDEVGLTATLVIFFGLFLLAASVTWALLAPFNWEAVVWLWLFPPGITGFLPKNDHDPSLAFIIGYSCYAFFLVLFLKFRRRPAFYVVIAFYVAFLLLNGVGCSLNQSRTKPRDQHRESFK